MTALRLGRVSNLPTVWTNTLAGVVLAGASPWQWGVIPVALGLSLAYLGGMFLNDAFDRHIDAVERPGRPIPSGAADANTVFALGFALLLAAVAVLLFAARSFGVPPGLVAAAGLALACAIVGYNVYHKSNPLSPLAMAVCRLLTYVAAGAAATATLSVSLFAGSVAALYYLIGLTLVAKHESRGAIGRFWPWLFLAAPLAYGAVLARRPVGLLVLLGLAGWIGMTLWLVRGRRPGCIPRAITGLIAGISLVDAMFLAAAGRPGAVPLALACFGATLLLQRWVSGI